MNIVDYFTPVEKENLGIDIKYSENAESLYQIDVYSSVNNDITGYDIALLGVEEERATSNEGTALAPNQIRKELYQLANHSKLKIIDLGNLKLGKSITDTYFGLADVIGKLIRADVLPIIMGGGQDLTFSMYFAMVELRKYLNLVTVDAKIDFTQNTTDYNAEEYLGRIISSRAKKIFNYANLGHQAYFCSPSQLKLLKKLKFAALRLGAIRTNIADCEPIMRDAHILSFDIGSIRQSDAPGHKNAAPNGLYSEEACQMARYAGISSNLQCFGLFEVNPNYDTRNQTSALAAQIIWYFIDGVADRTADVPKSGDKRYTKHIVKIGKTNQSIIFYQNNENKRWWIEVPYPVDNKKNIVVSCKHSDYLLATHQEIPEIWFNTIQKLQSFEI